LHCQKPRDNKIRTPNIPDTVKSNRINSEVNEITLERKVTNNKVKDLIEKNGGNSVFFVPDNTHFMLEKEEWKNDVIPEIMDGKNIFDFVDAEIDKKLQLLELEEDELLEKIYKEKVDKANDDEIEDGDIGLDDELLETHEKIMVNKEKVRKAHKIAINSQLPKMVRPLTETEDLMKKIRWDKGDLDTKFLSQRTKRSNFIKDRKEKIKKTRKDDEIVEDDSDEGMDLDDEEYANKVKIIEMKKKDENQKQIVVERLKRKIQKKLNRSAKTNESDRRIQVKLPRHLFSGHRTIGKTDWR